jgi:hypothetical protein
MRNKHSKLPTNENENNPKEVKHEMKEEEEEEEEGEEVISSVGTTRLVATGNHEMITLVKERGTIFPGRFGFQEEPVIPTNLVFPVEYQSEDNYPILRLYDIRQCRKH